MFGSSRDLIQKPSVGSYVRMKTILKVDTEWGVLGSKKSRM